MLAVVCGARSGRVSGLLAEQHTDTSTDRRVSSSYISKRRWHRRAVLRTSYTQGSVGISSAPNVPRMKSCYFAKSWLYTVIVVSIVYTIQSPRKFEHFPHPHHRLHFFHSHHILQLMAIILICITVSIVLEFNPCFCFYQFLHFTHIHHYPHFPLIQYCLHSPHVQHCLHIVIYVATTVTTTTLIILAAGPKREYPDGGQLGSTINKGYTHNGRRTFIHGLSTHITIGDEWWDVERTNELMNTRGIGWDRWHDKHAAYKSRCLVCGYTATANVWDLTFHMSAVGDRQRLTRLTVAAGVYVRWSVA